ncbi:MAG: dicarboxylate/amino acid:cation symporter [Nitrospinaceae bacterium]
MRHSGKLLYYILGGVILGLVSGWVFGEAMTAVDWMGTLFLNALKMLVVPLIISSLIVGVAGLGNVTKLGKTGVITLAYYMLTTGVSVALGLVCVNLLEPGAGVSLAAAASDQPVTPPDTGFTDIFLSLVTPNLIRAMADMDILPLIIFCLVFGAVLTTMGEKGKRMIEFFDAINEAVMRLVHLVLYLAPIGIFALIASKLGAAGGGEAFWGELMKIGKFTLTVLVGLGLHALVVLPLILWAVTGRSPLTYMKNAAEALTTAFSTASSSATLPVTIECAELNNKVSKRISLFVLPIGATVNMDGTALYEAVAAMFIAQMYGIPLGPGEQMVVFLTATLAAVGAAGIPEAGLVTMVMVLQSVGLPLDGIAMLLAIDWFLDRCRTMVNVWGDSVGAAVVERFEIRYVEGE